MNKRFPRAALGAVALLPIIAGAFVFQQKTTVESAKLLDQVLQITANRYVDTLGTGALYEKAARGLVKELNDPYSVLFSPKELAAFNQQTGGRYGGIGMEIAEVDKFVTVQRVFPNTPAAAGGVQEGDRIVQIDTANARGWTTQQVSDRLKGEPGTKVSVKFARVGVAEMIPVTFTRAIVHIPAVSYSMVLQGNVGYIPLQQFNETATDELQAAMDKVVKSGARSIVVDLRGNPGGILDQALSVSNLFLKKGQEISSVRGRSTEAQTFVASEQPAAPSIPMVVLIDGRSASASEIVAGALQDHDRALLVGTTSFGKGLVQTVFPLEGGWALKMTTAKWFTPSGRSIQKARKLLPGGDFVEVMPDSLETDSARRARPRFRSDAGRVVYGGGGVTPDMVVPPDTLNSAELKLLKELAPKQQVVASTLAQYALEMKSRVRPDFVVTPVMRAEFVRRLTAQGVKVDAATYAAGATELDRILGNRIASIAFGDSTAKRREIGDDNQLMRAIQVLQQSPTQAGLFAIAANTANTARAGQ